MADVSYESEQSELVKLSVSVKKKKKLGGIESEKNQMDKGQGYYY